MVVVYGKGTYEIEEPTSFTSVSPHFSNVIKEKPKADVSHYGPKFRVISLNGVGRIRVQAGAFDLSKVSIRTFDNGES